MEPQISDTACHLFVYGTLAPGEKNHHIMQPMKGTWQAAQLRAHYSPCSWGPYKGYPGLAPDESADWIKGHLFSSKDLPDHWARLDAFEGEAYERVEVKTQTATGHDIFAYVYRTVKKTINTP